MRILLLLLPLTMYAGQSLVLTPGVKGSFANSTLGQNESWRVEFQIHDWALPPQGVQNAYIFQLGGTGLSAALWGNGILAVTDVRDSLSLAAPCMLSLKGRQNVLVRFQRDAANKATVCEIWNSDGSGYQEYKDSITIKPWTQSGGLFGSANTNAALGFLRVLSSLIEEGGRPPVTADNGDLLNLTFGAGSSLSIASAPTPAQNPVAYVKTGGAPAWNNWVSLRAGFPAQLDGSRSFSLADGSSEVTYQWSQLSGPTTVHWSDTSAATPTIEGLIFGTYTFQLTVKDTSGQTASTTLQVGAVATDANGVVVQADPNADKLFGPMIAFGQNPWGYADERAIKATTLRSAAYDAQGLSNPTWQTPLAGTVTYKFWPPSTSISADVSASSMSIQVNDVTQLDLTTFPTRILLGLYPSEEVRICSASGNTLQVCYDGRGWRAGTGYHTTGATAWGKGTQVYQDKVKGTGTQFMKDFCPAGAGWSGPVSYQEGTVRVTPGSSQVSGNATAWANTNAGGRAIRIEGTHNGGIPFVFQAYIAGVNGATSLTLNRPWPGDADANSFKYALIDADTRNLTPHYTRSDGSDSIIYFFTSGCESDTSLYLYMWWDDGITGVQPDKQYSYMDGFGYVGDAGANYYDEVLAHYALYYRSGWSPARDAARKLGDNWLGYPEIANGDAGGIPRRMALTGAYAGAVLDGRTKNWSALRTFANRGVYAIKEDCNNDIRENGYEFSWLALAALFDPADSGSASEPNQRSYWKSKLADAATRDEACGGADHSWKTGMYWDPGMYPALTVSNGSAVATGSNLPASMCPYVASGTGTATANSAVITGSGFQAGAKILITGTRFGQPYTGGFEFRLNGPLQIALPVLWPGDSGPISWMIEPDVNFSTIAVDNVNDARFGQIWACQWNNPSQITLNRPWAGTGTETVHLFRYNLVGRGTQPFMLGIKTLQMSWASQVEDASTATRYKELAGDAANWILNVGYDPQLKAVSYGRIFPQCEPALTESGDATIFDRVPGCMENSANPGAVSQARARNSEVQNAFRVAYQTNPSGDVKALGDQAYCGQWGKAALTQPGYCTEAITASNVEDNNLGGYKWTGFFFGIGMAHQWPAVRLGGVSPAMPQTVSVDLDLSNAASARVTVTQPSSATRQFLCSSSPCQVEVDARQGAHWAQIEYLSSDGKVVSTSQPKLLPAVPAMAITPTTVTLNPSQALQFIVKTSGNGNAGFIWSITPAIGSISSDGLYTAPADITGAQSVRVKATSLTDESLSATSTIMLSPLPASSGPSVDSVSPSAGAGSRQTFTFVFSDTQGATSLSTAAIVFASALEAQNACYVIYDKDGTIRLDSDDATGYEIKPANSSDPLQNSQCTIGTSSVTMADRSITMTLDIAFKSDFAGPKNIYMYSAQADGSINTGWVPTGVFTVLAPPAP